MKKSATDGATRLFPKFSLADVSGWPKAFEEAAKGLVHALERVGHMQAAETHPGAQEILAHIGAGSLKGAKLKERFTGTAEAAPTVGTLQELLQSLAHCTPQRWAERTQAVAGKLQRGAAACAKKLEPTVQPYAAPARMVRSEAELDAWVEEVRQAVIAKLQSGPVQF